MLFNRKNTVLFAATLLCTSLTGTTHTKAQSSNSEISPIYNFDVETRNNAPIPIFDFYYRHYLDGVFIGETRVNSRSQLIEYIEPGNYEYQVFFKRSIDDNGAEAVYKGTVNISDEKIFRLRCVNFPVTKCNYTYHPRVVEKKDIDIAKEYETNISFEENLSVKTEIVEEIKVDPGVIKNYNREFSHTYSVNVVEDYKSIMEENLGLKVASSLYNKVFRKTENAASRQYGYDFSQQKTEGASIELNGSVCNRYQIVKTTKLRTGKITIFSDSGKEYDFDFNIIDSLDINAKNLCESS